MIFAFFAVIVFAFFVLSSVSVFTDIIRYFLKNKKGGKLE